LREKRFLKSGPRETPRVGKKWHAEERKGKRVPKKGKAGLGKK